MTRNVKSVTPTTPVRAIARAMIARRISAVPVVDRKRRVLGIVSEGDLLRRAEIGTERRGSWWLDLFVDAGTRAREFAKSRGLRAADVMTRSAISVTPQTDVRDIVDIMEKWGIKRVPVVKAGTLAGIVTRHDVLRALSRTKPKPRRAKGGDAAIREYLRKQMAAESWSSSNYVNVVVEKGMVELFGAVDTREQRDALGVMAENAPGVRAVKNSLTIMPILAGAV
jgi:CBS domain-containing protein